MAGALSIQDIRKQFTAPNGQRIEVLRSVSLDIVPGSFISLIGPLGCGKTTLLRLIAGLEKPSYGDLLLDGEKITAPGSEKGVVFQNHTLFPWLNIYNNIAFGLRVGKIYKHKENDVRRLIKSTGLEGFEKSFPHQLSKDIRQRASLAKGLVGHPQLLLLDEPLGALDAFTRMNMQDEMLKVWKEQSITMIMATHDVDEAVYMSDKVIVMTPRPGKVSKIIDIELARPRARSDPEFLKYRTRILNLLNFGGNIIEPNYFL